MKKTTILVADDDPQLLRLVMYNLLMEGYKVLTACDGQQGLTLIAKHVPDLVLLDVMMPKLDGFSVTQRVRAFSTVPIILMTTRGQDQDKIRGLDLGADDFLTKPFSIGELLARIHAILRRMQFAASGQGMSGSLMCGDVMIDDAQHLVMVAGTEVSLTPIEYRILAYLAYHAGRVVTPDALLEHVWGAAYRGERHLLQVNINRLRRKVEVDRIHPHFILTKAGLGYYLAASPTSYACEK
jgi:DNA-binding response OmpR family regulator